MSPTLQPPTLPLALRGTVERALRARAGHDEAIEAVHAHLERGGERRPEVLMALAALVYEDAACLVLSRLRQASEEALALLDEAEAAGAAPDALAPMRALFLETLARELAREDRIRRRAADEDTRATDLAALAHARLMRGDDELARALFRAASAASEERDDEPTGSTGSTGSRLEPYGPDASGVFRVAR